MKAIAGGRPSALLIGVGLTFAIVLLACAPPSNIPPAPPEAAAIENPIPAPTTPEGLEAARDLYSIHCARCHGYVADGYGPYYQLYSPHPADLISDIVQAQSDGTLFWKTVEGDLGTDLIDEHEGEATDDEVWTIIHWLREAPALAPEPIKFP